MNDEIAQHVADTFEMWWSGASSLLADVEDAEQIARTIYHAGYANAMLGELNGVGRKKSASAIG